MHTYYPSLEAIHQQTLQLDPEQCQHCRQTHQLVSHGFVRKKQVADQPAAVGKRVFCSNRGRRTGCGRTVQLYLAVTVRTLHYAGDRVVAFVLALLAGCSIGRAYQEATRAASDRHAYRWLRRLEQRISHYRSLVHHPPHPTHAQTPGRRHAGRRGLLTSTAEVLLQQFGQGLCQAYQSQWQRPLL